MIPPLDLVGGALRGTSYQIRGGDEKGGPAADEATRLLVGKVIVAEMVKKDKRENARGVFSRTGYVSASGRLTDRLFGVSCVLHDRFPGRIAPMARMCPTLVAENGKNAT